MKKENVKISIIMNCYNSDRFLSQAIDSVYAQTFTDWEIIFWDNASTDNSAEIANSYNHQLKYFRSDSTTPLGEARNLALKKAKGEYIAFLDCDDIYLPNKLQEQITSMKNSDYAMCYGGAIHIDELGKVISLAPAKYESGYIFPYLLERYEINMQSVMIRKKVLDDADMTFSTNLKYCPDHNLFMNLASHFKVCVINQYIVKYRIVLNSLSKRTIHLASSEIKFTLDKIIENNSELGKQYPVQFGFAYAKLNYYDAVNLIYQNNFSEARKCLKKIITLKWEYAVLYTLLLLPLSNKSILKLLNR